MEKIDYTRHYQNWHNDSQEHIKATITTYKKNILPYFPQNKETQILDIGCGMGFLLLIFKTRRLSKYKRNRC